MPSWRPSLRSPSRVGALLAALALLLVSVVAGGCSGGAPSAAPAGVTVAAAWVRPAPGSGGTTAAYFTITNGGSTADALLGVTSPVAGSCQLHESTMASGGDMGMHEMASVEVPAGGTTTFAPGGFHVMLDGLRRPLAAGETVELDLTFVHAGRIVVQADVRAS
jgi:copper(I)-binding protein